MNIEEFREHCLAVKGSEECFPFDDTVMVFKIMGKMFAYISIAPRDGEFRANLKCDPERSVELRERYEGIADGYYPGTLLWNGVLLESDVPDALIAELITHSVDEVVKKLTKAKRQEYLDL